MSAKWKKGMSVFWKEWLRPLSVIALAVFSFRSAVADWNDVPTGSMKPTIMEGDRIFVNKTAYDLKVPFTTLRLARWGEPRRGDIVVFYAPSDGTRMVKRVVGVSGDRIELRNNLILVNGEPLEYGRLDDWFVEQIPEGQRSDRHFAVETLGESRHPVMVTPKLRSLRTAGPFVVPPGSCFVMGDNRDNSMDSRFYGSVAHKQILGRATAVAFSLNPERHYLPRWGRFFKSLP